VAFVTVARATPPRLPHAVLVGGSQPLHSGSVTSSSGSGRAECWVVMPFFDHGNLDDLLKSSYRRGLEEKYAACGAFCLCVCLLVYLFVYLFVCFYLLCMFRYILHEVAAGLAHLHKQGFVHRGLTSRAILLSSDGRVALSRFHASLELGPPPCDWAFPWGPPRRLAAKPTPSRLRVHRAVLHEFYEDPRLVPWMAPEMLRQDLTGYGFGSDVYGLGILALEAVTGKHPFAGQAPTEMMLNKLQEAPPTLEAVCPNRALRCVALLFLFCFFRCCVFS
jgi:serine/threonine protein kinase